MIDTAADLVRQARALLAEAADHDPRMLTGEQIAAIETDLVALRTQADALIATHADAGETLDLPRRSGRSSMTSWIGRLTGCSAAEASKPLTTHRLVTDHPEALAAWTTGALSTDKTRAVGEALDRLPDEFTLEERALCEKTLLVDAHHLSLPALRRFGNRVFEMVAPEAADERLGEQLRRDEIRALTQTDLTIAPSGIPGIDRLTAHLPRVEAAKLAAMIEAMIAPRRRHLDSEDDTAPTTLRPAQQRGHAFCDLIDRIQPPCDAGGTAATLVVTVDHRTLLDDLGTATLATGEEISAGEARRLACDAGILPAVLDGPSQILDLAPERRLHTRRQRITLAHRDGGCSWEGCDRPPGWCETHHLVPYDDGGPTTVENGALFCGYHHRLLHSGDWTARLHPIDHIVEVIPPTRIDPHQRPRRHERHPTGLRW